VKARVSIFVKGVNKLHCFWDLQGIMDRNRPLTSGGLNFEFLLIHVDGDLETSQEWEFGKMKDIHRHIILE